MTKRIHVIEHYPEGLRTVKSYLSDINGNYKVFSSVNDAAQSGEKSDLVILLARRKDEHLKEDVESLHQAPFFSDIPKMVLFPYKMPDKAFSGGYQAGWFPFQLPVNKVAFLSTVAKFLKIPPRRVLQMVITVQPEGDNIKYTGISIDFSETGLAFRSNADFPLGQKTSLNFVNPVTRKRLFLKAKVVRRSAVKHDNIAFYGMTFSELSSDGAEELRLLVNGDNRQ